MKRVLRAIGEPEININNRCTCAYRDQFGNDYLVEYKVLNLDSETFEDVADWDDYTIYEGGLNGKNVTETFEEVFIKCNRGYEQGFISLNGFKVKENEKND